MLTGHISHYRIVDQIGVGGMGVVYKAIDIQLDRAVALKVLPDHLAHDAEAVARLKREARAASALNDPGICTIFEVGESNGTVFIAMELLDGHTLGHRMKAGPIPVRDVVEIALAVVTALEHAHGRGVLHRDITPANIFLTTEGRVKLLDFGLARVDPAQATPQFQRTMTALSMTGQIAGTLPYMSPEQLKGAVLDARTDLFSLGVVLYEALTGTHLFQGTAAEVASGILTANPAPVSGAAPIAPSDIDRVVAKALEKDRELRYQTASELRADLKRLRRDLEGGGAVTTVVPVPVPAPRRAGIALGMALGAALFVGIALGGYFWTRPAPAPSLLADATFMQISDLPGLETFPTLSADGQTIVFASAHEGRWRIYSQRVSGRNLIDLTGDSTVDDTQPALSPDGSRIAFRSTRDGGGIFVMGATGESVRRITDFGFNPSWAPDGQSIAIATEIVEAPTSRMAYSAMWAVDVTTGARRMVTDDNAVQPAWSPHGSRIAYWKVDSSGNRDIYTVPAEGGEPVAVTLDAYTDWSPTWSPDGRFLFFSSDRGGSMNLWRVPLDEATGLVTGPFEPVTTPALNSGLLTFSRDGSHLAYVAQTTARNVMHVAFDPRLRRAIGPVTPVTRGTRYLRFPSVSPDGLSIAYTSDEKLMVSRIDGSAPRQLTDGAYRDRAPRWSPDGSTLLFYTNRTGSYEVWAIHPDGSGLRQVTFGGDAVTFFYPVWSPDGRAVAFGDLRNRSSYVYTIGDRWSLPPALPPPPTERSVFAPWSWSRSAGLAGWALGENGQSGGLLIFAPDTGVYRRLPVAATRPLWLPGDTHLLAHQSEGLLVVDGQTGATTPIVLPEVVDEEFTLSPDGSSIYFMQSESTGDIWLMTLGSANRTQP